MEPDDLVCAEQLRAGHPKEQQAHHEEVQAGKGDQVDGQLAQVAVQLACAHTTCQEARVWAVQCTQPDST